MIGCYRILLALLLAAALSGVAGPVPVAWAGETRSFTNNTDILIPGSGTGATTGAQGSVYPSEITVSGFPAGHVVTSVRVTLTGLTHTFPDDIDIMLVSPDGSRAVIFSDIGGEHNVSNVTITLDDASTNQLPASDQLTSGTFDPRNNNVGGDTPDAFPSPAPTPGTGVTMASFRGDAPNGIWKLFVADDKGVDSGLLSGWTLEITSNDPPVLGLPSAAPTYTTGGPPILIDPLATVTDSDSTNLDGGGVIVSLPTNSFADDDLIGIRHQGNGPGEIGVTFTTATSGRVAFGGTEIGTFSGAAGSQTQVSLNSSATPAAVQALLRNLTYTITTLNPPRDPRTITIRVSDGDGASDSETKTITVLAPPVAANDAYSVNSGVTLTVPAATGVLGNDTDADSPAGSLQAQVVANVQRGTLALQATGAFTYTPNQGVSGTDTFTYRAVDPEGNTSGNGTATITVFAPPVAVNDAYGVNGGSTLTVPAATGVLANDTDADTPAASLQAQVVANAQRGTLAFQANGSFTYTPNQGVAATDTFTYRVVDPQGNASGTATVTITVAVVLAPVAVSEAYSVNNGATLTVPAATGVLANDTDADTPAGSLQAQVVATPQRGTLSLQANGGFTYTPNPSVAGTDTFTYRVVDPQGNASAPATATITVNQVACGPRPSVTVTTTVSGGALQATVTASDVTGPTGNRLVELGFGQLQNAQVTISGQSVAGGQTVALPGGTTTATFTVRRAASGQATTVPLTVVDVCGSWPTFVGGGAGSGF